MLEPSRERETALKAQAEARGMRLEERLLDLAEAKEWADKFVLGPIAMTPVFRFSPMAMSRDGLYPDPIRR